MTSTKPEDVFKGVFSQQSFNFSLKQLSNWRALYCSNDLLLQKDFLADICFQMLKILILRQTLFSQKRQGSSRELKSKQNCFKTFSTLTRPAETELWQMSRCLSQQPPHCFKHFSDWNAPHFLLARQAGRRYQNPGLQTSYGRYYY